MRAGQASGKADESLPIFHLKAALNPSRRGAIVPAQLRQKAARLLASGCCRPRPDLQLHQGPSRGGCSGRN